MRAAACAKGSVAVVPPKKNRKRPLDYNKVLYKKRNEVEWYFLRLKRFLRVFIRYDKLDVVFVGFISFAMIANTLVSVNKL